MLNIALVQPDNPTHLRRPHVSARRSAAPGAAACGAGIGTGYTGLALLYLPEPPSPKLESYVRLDSSFLASFSFLTAFMKSS